MISKPDLDRLRRIKGKAGDGRIAEVGANLVLDVVFVALLSSGIEGGAAAATAATQLFSALVCYGYLRRTPDVELVPSGDYAVLLHRKNDRLPWRWDDIRSMSEFLQKRGVTNFGDGFSCVGGSGEKNGSPVNFHKRMVKLIT